MKKLSNDVLFFAVLWLVLAYCVFAKPDKDAPPRPKKDAPVPVIAGPTRFGAMGQAGRKLTIRGNESWEADGEIRRDGSIFLVWTHIDGRKAQALYKLDKGKIVGAWGWEAVVPEVGEAKGLIYPETLRGE